MRGPVDDWSLVRRRQDRPRMPAALLLGAMAIMGQPVAMMPPRRNPGPSREVKARRRAEREARRRNRGRK